MPPSTILTVTNANDAGPGSLRQAVVDASNGDVIRFDNNYSIYLNNTLEIAKRLTIDGGNHVITVSGDTNNDGTRNVRVFYISSTGVVTLSNLSVVSGTTDYGGGIYNNGILTVQNSTVSNNSASSGGGIRNDSTLTLNRSILSGNRV